MSFLAGIDYSTHAIDVVLLDEDDPHEAAWHRFGLSGQDAFERARNVRRSFTLCFLREWDDVLAVGIEEPRGHNAGALYRVQGAILARLPHDILVQPWVPSEWRKAVGLPGNASKEAVVSWAVEQPGTKHWQAPVPPDAFDAYCIALATLRAIERGEEAA